MSITVELGDARIVYGDAGGTLAGNIQYSSAAVSAFSVDAGLAIFAVGDANSLLGYASGGNDTVQAFAFSNGTALGDAFTISGHARGGDDVVSGSGIGGGTAFGDATLISGSGAGGHDHVAGVLAHGDALQMTDHSYGGNDTVIGVGGDGQSWAYGDAETMSGSATGGDDSITAGGFFGFHEYGDALTLKDYAHGGDDTLAGSAFRSSATQAAVMYGDGQTLADHAHAGNDVLISGENDEQMWGDAEFVGPQATRGVNRFVFAPSNGHDQIMDFQPGADRIELMAGDGVASFSDLASHLQDTPDGALIGNLNYGSDILLRGITVSQLSASDFLFG